MDPRPVYPARGQGFSAFPVIMIVGCLVGVLLIAGAGSYVFMRKEQSRHVAMREAEMHAMVAAQHHARSEAELRAAPVELRPNPLERENRELREKVARLEEELKAAKAPAPSPVKPAVDLEKDFSDLAEDGLASYGNDAFKELVKKLKDAGKEGLDLAIRHMLQSESAIDRFLAAALIEGIKDPAAIPALAQAAKDKDDLTRRMVVHALAFIGSDAAEAPLKEAMLGDADWGVRTNASYGLAKLGRDEGVANLVKYYESPDTPAAYRMPILGGLADVAAPSTAPLFRGILRDSKELGALLAAIGALQKMKDTGAINDLKRVAETGEPASVRQAAERAIQAIQK